MIIDTFMFFNELDTLEIRLRELEHEVDCFVLLESGETLAGIPKPFIFEQNRDRFERFLNKIRHVKLQGLPPLIEDTEESRFWLESYQRNALMLGLLGQGLTSDDIVMISDVDEIPRASGVRQVRENLKAGEVWVFEQRLHYYYFDHKMEPELSASPWLGTVAVNFSAFGRLLPEQIRREWAMAATFKSDRHSEDATRHMVADGGWHLSYFGGNLAQMYKRMNFAHGAGGIYGNPNTTQPASIERSAMSGVQKLDSVLSSHLRKIISEQLKDNVPSAVSADLDAYYHHFQAAHL